MIESLAHGLIVSCQAEPTSPLFGPEMMSRLALCAVAGGAAGIRANGPADIRAIKDSVAVPVIGLYKRAGSPVYITPSLRDAQQVAEAGADLVAVDATLRPRPDGTSPARFLASLVAALPVPVIADVDSLEAASMAAAAGAAVIATTLAGYTGGPIPTGPDIGLVGQIASALSLPVFAEGRYHDPESVAAAFTAGAFAVVVGEAITDPAAITRRFVAARSAGQR